MKLFIIFRNFATRVNYNAFRYGKTIKWNFSAPATNTNKLIRSAFAVNAWGPTLLLHFGVYPLQIILKAETLEARMMFLGYRRRYAKTNLTFRTNSDGFDSSISSLLKPFPDFGHFPRIDFSFNEDVFMTKVRNYEFVIKKYLMAQTREEHYIAEKAIGSRDARWRPIIRRYSTFFPPQSHFFHNLYHSHFVIFFDIKRIIASNRKLVAGYRGKKLYVISPDGSRSVKKFSRELSVNNHYLTFDLNRRLTLFLAKILFNLQLGGGNYALNNYFLMYRFLSVDHFFNNRFNWLKSAGKGVGFVNKLFKHIPKSIKTMHDAFFSGKLGEVEGVSDVALFVRKLRLRHRALKKYAPRSLINVGGKSAQSKLFSMKKFFGSRKFFFKRFLFNSMFTNISYMSLHFLSSSATVSSTSYTNLCMFDKLCYKIFVKSRARSSGELTENKLPIFYSFFRNNSILFSKFFSFKRAELSSRSLFIFFYRKLSFASICREIVSNKSLKKKSSLLFFILASSQVMSFFSFSKNPSLTCDGSLFFKKLIFAIKLIFKKLLLRLFVIKKKKTINLHFIYVKLLYKFISSIALIINRLSFSSFSLRKIFQLVNNNPTVFADLVDSSSSDFLQEFFFKLFSAFNLFNSGDGGASSVTTTYNFEKAPYSLLTSADGVRLNNINSIYDLKRNAIDNQFSWVYLSQLQRSRSNFNLQFLTGRSKFANRLLFKDLYKYYISGRLENGGLLAPLIYHNFASVVEPASDKQELLGLFDENEVNALEVCNDGHHAASLARSTASIASTDVLTDEISSDMLFADFFHDIPTAKNFYFNLRRNSFFDHLIKLKKRYVSLEWKLTSCLREIAGFSYNARTDRHFSAGLITFTSKFNLIQHIISKFYSALFKQKKVFMPGVKIFDGYKIVSDLYDPSITKINFEEETKNGYSSRLITLTRFFNKFFFFFVELYNNFFRFITAIKSGWKISLNFSKFVKKGIRPFLNHVWGFNPMSFFNYRSSICAEASHLKFEFCRLFGGHSLIFSDRHKLFFLNSYKNCIVNFVDAHYCSSMSVGLFNNRITGSKLVNIFNSFVSEKIWKTISINAFCPAVSEVFRPSDFGSILKITFNKLYPVFVDNKFISPYFAELLRTRYNATSGSDFLIKYFSSPKFTFFELDRLQYLEFARLVLKKNRSLTLFNNKKLSTSYFVFLQNLFLVYPRRKFIYSHLNRVAKLLFVKSNPSQIPSNLSIYSENYSYNREKLLSDLSKCFSVIFGGNVFIQYLPLPVFFTGSKELMEYAADAGRMVSDNKSLDTTTRSWYSEYVFIAYSSLLLRNAEGIVSYMCYVLPYYKKWHQPLKLFTSVFYNFDLKKAGIQSVQLTLRGRIHGFERAGSQTWIWGEKNKLALRKLYCSGSYFYKDCYSARNGGILAIHFWII